jgi:hypothetical protein
VGIEAVEEVHPLAIQVMREVGLDISQQKPMSLHEFLDVHRNTPLNKLIILSETAYVRATPICRKPFTATTGYLTIRLNFRTKKRFCFINFGVCARSSKLAFVCGRKSSAVPYPESIMHAARARRVCEPAFSF